MRRLTCSTLHDTLFPCTTLCRSARTLGRRETEEPLQRERVGPRLFFELEALPATLAADPRQERLPGFDAVDQPSLGRVFARVEAGVDPPADRSEEHTSELQSLNSNSYDVFCLKKKNKLNKI